MWLKSLSGLFFSLAAHEDPRFLAPLDRSTQAHASAHNRMPRNFDGQGRPAESSARDEPDYLSDTGAQIDIDRMSNGCRFDRYARAHMANSVREQVLAHSSCVCCRSSSLSLIGAIIGVVWVACPLCFFLSIFF